MLFGKKKDTEVESVGMLSEAEKMGIRISELRRKRNLTQNELAEKLGISFQAVSSWERGMTMPDIMNLKELAGILEVTSDELLDSVREDAEMYDRKDNPFDSPESEDRSIRESDMGSAGETSEEDDEEESSDEDGDFYSHFSLLPFISEEDLFASVNERMDESGKPVPFEVLVSMAPFLDKEKLGKIFEKAVSMGAKPDLHFAASLFPFLGDEKVQDIVMKHEPRDRDLERHLLPAAAPFLSEERLLEAAEALYSPGEYMTTMDFLNLAPFLSKESNGRLLSKVKSDKGDILNDKQFISSSVPFLPEKLLSEILKGSLDGENDFVETDETNGINETGNSQDN